MPTPGSWPVRHGTAELYADDDRPSGWLLLVDGVAQSYVDLDEPITAVHLGGGGCTLPRYIAATRPGSTQVVLEGDDLLAAVVRRELGTAGFRLRVGDARTDLAALRPETSDVVVSDVFAGSTLPLHCTTLEYVEEIRRLLRPGGTYIANIGDGPPFGFARGQAATLRAAFAHVVLIADPGVLRGRRFGNLVMAGSDTPFQVAELSRLAARAVGRARVLSGAAVRDFTGGAKPVTDATAADAPAPPADLFRRGS